MLAAFDRDDPAGLVNLVGPMIAVSLMATGMVGAAMSARFRIGLSLALMSGGAMVAAVYALGIAPISGPASVLLALAVGSVSFAARGALFARSAGARGWWIAGFIVGGEAAMLITAYVSPKALPDWLIVLLPAQWTSIAVKTALLGIESRISVAALAALGGTAAATLLVWWLWPRRWPYTVMFTTWLGFSALVYHQPAPPLPPADQASSLHTAERVRANSTRA
ncbi:MAG: hypothetical protein V2I27_11160 [Erythrobacter sp.]|nr:hypothetical protein [Erythrobacter sp.]